jgi:hypothetical protein
VRRRNWNKSEEGKAWAKAYYKTYMPMRQKENVEYLNKIKREGKCADCGEDNYILLQFHHREGREKYRVYAFTRFGLARLKAEIAKCDLLCANCHIKRHHAENSGYFSQRKDT